MKSDLKAAVAELRREGRIVDAPVSPVSILRPHQLELLELYSSGISGVELAERLGVSYQAAQQRLKRMAAHLRVAKVRDLKAWHTELAAA